MLIYYRCTAQRASEWCGSWRAITDEQLSDVSCVMQSNIIRVVRSSVQQLIVHCNLAVCLRYLGGQRER